MSTNVGTLQPKVHIRGPLVWTVVALFVAATIGVYALTTTESREETASSRTTVAGTAANTPSELGTVISFPPAMTAVAVRTKQLGLDTDIVAPSTAVQVMEARNAMLASYQHAPIAVEIVDARNAMLASYQEGSGDEILVNGEPCAICWKYR